MSEDKTNASGEYSVPGNINSVEDTRPYVGRCIEAMLDDGNYSLNINGHKGIAYLSRIADNALAGMGFGREAARWMTHPFHWLFVSDLKIVEMKGFKKPEQVDGELIRGVWVLDRGKAADVSVDSLTDTFMQKYGQVFYAKIERIRADPNYCKS